MLGFKELLTQAAQFAALMVQRIQMAQFRHGTPARSRMRVHDRSDGPNSPHEHSHAHSGVQCRV
jgi:hypothetical protein